MSTPEHESGPVDFGFTPRDVLVVTGAGSGIGRAIAIRAAQLGLTVAAWDINASTVEATVEQIRQEGGRGLAVAADVGSDEDVLEAHRVSRELGRVRHLVNNAGPPSSSELPFDAAVQLCVGSVRRVTQAWLDAGVPQRSSVVNIASVAGTVVGTSPDWYPTAKAAIMGYTRHLATHRSEEIRANAVAPGMTDTPRLADFADSELGRRVLDRIPLRRMASADDIAYATLFLLSPLAGYINGVLLPVDGGWTISQ